MGMSLSFHPPWWAIGPHAQTMGARMLRPKGRLPLRRERWNTPDGDFVDLDFADIEGLREDALVLLLHGLEGSARSGYAYQLYEQLSLRGLQTVGLNFRSCSGELNRGLRLYHSGGTEDRAWVLHGRKGRFPGRQLAAVGVSLGGNVVLKYLGESGGDSGLEAAAAMSVPFDLSSGADFMEQGFAQVYVRRLLRSLKTKMHIRVEELGPLIDVERTSNASTFREFDDAATAPLHGFGGAADYYARSSSAAFLGAIRTPTLVVHSMDDPFLPAGAIPTGSLEANAFLQPVITRRGGHVGFVTGANPLKPVFWAENVIADWLVERLG
ncbi:MAG: alpha/beta fold hydrolase [Acidobacteriota bacterium]